MTRIQTQILPNFYPRSLCNTTFKLIMTHLSKLLRYVERPTFDPFLTSLVKHLRILKKVGPFHRTERKKPLEKNDVG